jgi:hypothetical protein
MRELQNELGGTDLANLQFFNITYLIITQSVYAKSKTHFFENEIIMKDLDINFAKYYFDALKDYADGKKTTPAWQVFFDFCKQNTSIPLIYLALGVNAHVNNDLGFSLFDVVNDTDFTSDFNKVNPVISASLDTVVSEVGLPKFYIPFMKLLIIYWRTKAWNNYGGLKQKTRTTREIEIKAQKIAVSLAKINSVKDFYHLNKIV